MFKLQKHFTLEELLYILSFDTKIQVRISKELYLSLLKDDAILIKETYFNRYVYNMLKEYYHYVVIGVSLDFDTLVIRICKGGD